MRVTASKAALAMRCLYWAREDVTLPAEEANEAMARGSAIHAAIATTLLGGTTPEWPEQVARASGVFHATMRAAGATARVYVEPAYSWAGGGARFLGENIERKYREHGALEGSVCGSADLLVVAGRVGWQADWKASNGWDDFNTRYGDQNRTLAAMAASAFGLDTVHVATVNVDSDAAPEWKTLDAFDLAETGAWLDALPAAIEKAAPQPGQHCDRCPARTTCPETTKALVAAPSWSLDTPEDVARVWDRLKPIEDAIAAIRRKAREYVEANGPLTLPSGKRLALVESKGRESIAIGDLPRAVAADLRALGLIKCGAPTKSLREVK